MLALESRKSRFPAVTKHRSIKRKLVIRTFVKQPFFFSSPLVHSFIECDNALSSSSVVSLLKYSRVCSRNVVKLETKSVSHSFFPSTRVATSLPAVIIKAATCLRLCARNPFFTSPFNLISRDVSEPS